MSAFLSLFSPWQMGELFIVCVIGVGIAFFALLALFELIRIFRERRSDILPPPDDCVIRDAFRDQY